MLTEGLALTEGLSLTDALALADELIEPLGCDEVVLLTFGQGDAVTVLDTVPETLGEAVELVLLEGD